MAAILAVIELFNTCYEAAYLALFFEEMAFVKCFVAGVIKVVGRAIMSTNEQPPNQRTVEKARSAWLNYTKKQNVGRRFQRTSGKEIAEETKTTKEKKDTWLIFVN